MSVPDLIRLLRLVLENSTDAPSFPTLLENIDAFVQEHVDDPNAESLTEQIEDGLQSIYNDVVDHSVTSHLEVFLAILYHLQPLLPPISAISTWFELVIRPALREPKLATPAVNHAKELILSTLEWTADTEEVSEAEDAQRERYRELVGNFRRRLMDYYLLDAYNESSGDDVLEWADLDDLTKEKRACWKANLQDILVKAGLQRPKDLLTEVYRCFSSASSRLQLLLLLNAFTSQPGFPDRAAEVTASHLVVRSLLHSLTFDNSTTLCTVGLTMLTKLLPIFAVKACEQLKCLLPSLLIVLARMIRWKHRPRSTLHELSPEDLGMSPDVIKDVVGDSNEPAEFIDNRNTLPIRPDLYWERLDLVFDGAMSTPPSPHQYFRFLYYLFPCNTLRFLRFPIQYLTENNVECPYTMSWEDALDEDMIRSKSEPLLHGHVLHPLLIWRDAAAELAQPDFWAKYDIPQIVAECTMLDVRNAALGSREQEQLSEATKDPQSSLLTSSQATPVVDPETGPPLSISAESSDSLSMAGTPRAPTPRKPRISLQEMINTSITLKSGLEIDIVDTSPTWPTRLFQQPSAQSPTHEIENTINAAPDDVSSHQRKKSSSDHVPVHVAQAIAELQREVLVLRSELNFELWMARENVRHIGRLYHDRVLSRSAEMERQGLHNKMRELKAEVQRLQRDLKNHKDQTMTMKSQHLDYSQKLQEKVRDLRTEKSSWLAEATAMRAADKELRDSFAAQSKLLAEAQQDTFQLKTEIKESAHKVDRLHDYERQIEQLVKMQRLWETDVKQLNVQNEYLKVFTSKYRKMELQVETYESILAKMEEEAKHQRLQAQTLEARLNMTQKELEIARRSPSQNGLSQYHEKVETLTHTNERLREDNAVLRDEIEEMRAMVESLKTRVAGPRDLTSSASSSPLTRNASPPSMF